MSVKKRGPVSAAELAIVPMTPLGAVERLKPPHDLTDEETEIWVAVTNNEAADWFSPSTAPLLAQYCRHVISARQLAEIKERAHQDMDLAQFDKILQMQARESSALSMLATKMRITPQSLTNHRGNKKPTQARKLWE